MIEQLKTTTTKINLYGLISIYEIHREILYTLLKKDVVSTNISDVIFFEKLNPIQECDVISFYKYEKLKKELLDECLALYIKPMIDGWEIKRIFIDNGSTVNVCSHKFLVQLQEKGVQIPPLDEATFHIRAYDNSYNKPIGIAIIMVTTRVRTIVIKF